MTGQLHAPLAPDLVALVHDLDEDKSDAANDAGRHQNEDAGHIFETKRGRRLFVVLAQLAVAPLDPALVQVLHEATCQTQHLIILSRNVSWTLTYVRESRARIK